jgi:hypothetical protein
MKTSDIRSAFCPTLLAAMILAMAGPVDAQTAPQDVVTFSKDIAPILQRSCQNCHRPGAMAPMILMTYKDVRPWVRAIKLRTASREMPPWFIDKTIGIQKFKDDPSLSDEEIQKIARWVDSGSPEGNPADMPPPRVFPSTDGWTLGTPDLVVSSPVTIVKPLAPDWHGNLSPTPTGLKEDRYIKSVEIREIRLGSVNKVTGDRAASQAADLNYFVLHHADITNDPDIWSGAEDVGEARDPRERRVAQDEQSRTSPAPFRITYELGQNPLIFPDDAAQLLKADAMLYFAIHLHSIGREVPMRVDVGFKFHPKGYKPKFAGSRIAVMGNLGEDLDIPAGEANVRFDTFYTMPQPGRLMTFEPHMHASGKRFCVQAIYPDGLREMLNCSGYNHNWVKVYTYDDDVAPLLPKGTVMHIMGWYDNSAGNPRNVEPRNWKGYGNRSIDDMFLFLPQMVFLTDEQFNEQVAARKARSESSQR